MIDFWHTFCLSKLKCSISFLLSKEKCSYKHVCVCMQAEEKKKVEENRIKWFLLLKLRENTRHYRCLSNSFCFFSLQILHPLGCYKEAERLQEKQRKRVSEPISACRAIRHSFVIDKWKKTLFFKNEHSLTYSLTRLLLLIINHIKAFSLADCQCIRSQSKSNFALVHTDLYERSYSMSIILLTLRRRPRTERESAAEIIAFFFLFFISFIKEEYRRKS